MFKNKGQFPTLKYKNTVQCLKIFFYFALLSSTLQKVK